MAFAVATDPLRKSGVRPVEGVANPLRVMPSADPGFGL
ncbi:hypothetical protein B005_5322 [Nocardiopsis alba ATCC BAA-2165]|uniref:Uncharacterized protein n=1 Tax=Nocardiopsis alba (strain ATCC BAA-2165 / BE74) TaxID=1205910 RepID=J7L9E7_NOCAA|nr:hypothetical protein B005_5322 [Nocardiopsis alba ATCC BAA-2165]